MTTRCMGCMQPLESKTAACPHCGYPAGGVNPAEYLQVHTVLNDRYMLGRVLEIGGDSAVYIGLDRNDDSIVTVREFFPAGICTREEDGSLLPMARYGKVMAEYKVKFLSVARAVARLRDVLVVVPSFDIFEQNGTAYSVSEYCQGTSLEKYVAEHGGRLPFDEVRRLFLPLLSALSTIHACGVLHLGISPKNVLVDAEGKLRIKNFAIPETRTVNTECKPYILAGYAAPEQYEAGVTCTPSADVYGVAATMLFALTGVQPADATHRTKKSEELLLPTEVAKTVPAHVKESLYRALRIHPERRTGTIQQLLDELTATPAVAALIEEDKEPEEPKVNPRRNLWLVFGAALVVLVIVMVVALSGLNALPTGAYPQSTTTNNGQLTMDSQTTTTTGTTADMRFTVENLLGKDVRVAQKKVIAGSMKVEIKGYEYSDTAAENTIISQTPAPDEKADRGTTIYVVVSAGSAKRAMPNLAGWKEEHARLYLEALGYEVAAESMLLQMSPYEKGVVERSVPAAGSPITVGDKVTLYVSNVESQTGVG
ncbi:MAG: PASTA domain-containing protein [Clostridia bacterium]|nr:PASTA domain-containing protein [Clostridia bacterium]